MKCLVCGSRRINDEKYIFRVLDEFRKHVNITAFVSGTAKGPDSIVIEYGKSRCVEVLLYPADWKHFGRSAGIIRNVEMSKIADIALAFWDGKSAGTKHMIETMRKANKPVKIIKGY